MKIAVIGAGGWGTALSIVLDSEGHDIVLWGRDTLVLKKQRENKKYLPGARLSDTINITSENEIEAELYVVAIPVQFVRNVLVKLKLNNENTVVSASKGIELGTLKRPSEVLEEIIGAKKLFVLSGPSHAEEVSRFLPTSIVLASKKIDVSIQAVFSSKTIRVYTSEDVLGVEYAAALKNIIAVAAGICDGLHLGDNAKASLLSRGIQEMARIGEALGAKKGTFFGLAGIGDLITTCTSQFGRNLMVGREIGSGKTLEEVLASTVQVAEGVATTKAVFELAKQKLIEAPITAEVYSVLFEKKSPREALFSLMTRKPKKEEV